MADVEECQKAIPFLRSCKKECAQPITGNVRGEIPSWLNGNLVRVGSGLLEIGPDKMNHLFDGMSLMHGFSIQDGKVTYTSRFLRSDAYKKNMEANRVIVSEFGTLGAPDLCKTIFQRVSSLFTPREPTDNDLVNIIQFSDEYYAVTETKYIWKINPENLESLQKVDLSQFVEAKTAIAHSHQDPDGTVYNMGTSFTPRAWYNVLKFPPKVDGNSSAFDKASIVCKIPANNLSSFSYYHSFGMSEKYFVFIEQPLLLNLSSVMFFNLLSTPISEKLKWNPQQKAIIHVARRDTGELLKRKYLANPLFVFHHINTYEENDHLVVDVCSYKNDISIKGLYIEALKDSFAKGDTKNTIPFDSQSIRFVLPLNEDGIAKKIIGENLVTLDKSIARAVCQQDGSILCDPEYLLQQDSWYSELPRINYEKYNGKKYKYFYAIARKMDSIETSLIKVDTESKTELSWSEIGMWPSEPVFVPNPNSSDEDDGVLVGSLLDRKDPQKVSFIVLNAKTMTELGRTEFQTEASVPADFHGIFIPKELAS